MNALKKLCLWIAALVMHGCNTLDEAPLGTIDPVILPFIKNTANECYYVDEFMPVPDNMVTGKYGALGLRYYNYKHASYKNWQSKQIILSFYSQDGKCWSLFEEYYVTK